MTGSEKAGLIVGMLGIGMFAIGIIILLIAGVVAIFSYQWWIFIIGGICFLVALICWGLLRISEHRYYAARRGS